jgi:hypothetical protein
LTVESRPFGCQISQLDRGHAGRRGSGEGERNGEQNNASDRRARGGDVIKTLAEANGAVLAEQWGEAANEHGGDVSGVVGGGSYVCTCVGGLPVFYSSCFCSR